jgi:hypothetical protein
MPACVKLFAGIISASHIQCYAIMLSVIMLSFVMLKVSMLSVVGPLNNTLAYVLYAYVCKITCRIDLSFTYLVLCNHAECHYAQFHDAESQYAESRWAIKQHVSLLTVCLRV